MMDLIAGFLISPLSYKYEPMWTKTSPGVEWRVVANLKKKNPDIYKFLWYLYARVFLPIIQSLLIKPNWYDALLWHIKRWLLLWDFISRKIFYHPYMILSRLIFVDKSILQSKYFNRFRIFTWFYCLFDRNYVTT